MPNSKFFFSAAVLSVLLGVGSASAADLPARTYSKAPMMAPIYNWTGFYINGGGGYGMWDADVDTRATVGGAILTTQQRMGGHGYFGTVGAGYDWQFAPAWVGGIFADGQFGSIRGTIQDAFTNTSGRETDKTNWAAGIRVGYLVAPTVLSYVNGGYSGASFSGATLAPNLGGAAVATTPSFRRDGWFVGGGVENQLGFFGFGPGWFMKTEYRAAEYSRVTLPETSIATGLPNGLSTTFKPIVQTVSTQLVYRFNWSGVPTR